MTDIWSFLLQTLTASGAAALLLAVKAMFRDKLTPRWHFAAWGILALTLLFPAGLGGRYTLVNWPLFVETWKSGATGDFGTLTRVIAPVPLPPPSRPAAIPDWLFVLYAAGVVFFLARYALAYLRLRIILRKGKPAALPQLQRVAERYDLPVCAAVEVTGLPSAFVCGILRPVLALPAGVETDEKVLLHELLHLKHRDVLWGIVICFFRCVHWCNPLLWYCADQAGNDLESLCDQRVLERLEGEDRRDYGRILLSMADDRYARTPGTSSMANGGKNIRRRIEAIVRFKKYPRGMALVSVCIALVLTVPLLAGQRAGAAQIQYQHRDRSDDLGCSAAMAAARTLRCTTYAGAFDAYAKAVLDANVLYRAMCAPLSEQNALAWSLQCAAGGDREGSCTWEDFPLYQRVNVQSGYQIYNVYPAEDGAWEGLLVVELYESPEGKELSYPNHCWLAAQAVRAEKQAGRWVALPQEDFRIVESEWGALNGHGNDTALPALVYEARSGDFVLQMRRQSCSQVDSYVTNQNVFFSSMSFDATPQPDGKFSTIFGQELYAVYTGSPADKSRYTHIAASTSPLREGDERPALENPGMTGNSSYNAASGSDWGGRSLETDWESPVFLTGGGWSGSGWEVPDSYAADLYLNGALAAQLALLPVEGDGYHG